jgi:DNA-binding Lrp family transcriptional regulator
MIALHSHKFCVITPSSANLLRIATVDDIDAAILGLLVEQGRRSASDIGRIVGLSPAATKRRIDRLEALGIIKRYTAVLDHAKLGNEIEAFTELRFPGRTEVADIDATVANLPELVEAFTVAGDPDALVRFRVKDLDHLKRVIDHIRRSGSVTGTKTMIVLGTTRGTGANSD